MKFSFSFGTFIIRLLNIWCDAWHGPFLSLVVCVCVNPRHGLMAHCFLLLLLFVTLLYNTESVYACWLTVNVVRLFFRSSCVAATVAHFTFSLTLHYTIFCERMWKTNSKHVLQKNFLATISSQWMSIHFVVFSFFNLIQRNFPFI